MWWCKIRLILDVSHIRCELAFNFYSKSINDIDKWLMVDVFSFEVDELLIFCWWSVDVLLMLEKSVDILLTTPDLQEHRPLPSWRGPAGASAQVAARARRVQHGHGGQVIQHALRLPAREILRVDMNMYLQKAFTPLYISCCWLSWFWASSDWLTTDQIVCQWNTWNFLRQK